MWSKSQWQHEKNKARIKSGCRFTPGSLKRVWATTCRSCGSSALSVARWGRMHLHIHRRRHHPHPDYSDFPQSHTQSCFLRAAAEAETISTTTMKGTEQQTEITLLRDMNPTYKHYPD